jgi:environmental stress-induced protein Ves
MARPTNGALYRPSMGTVLSLADVAPTPWKNGGGVTRELWRRDGAEPGVFEARISVANVDAPGPFSAYPGYDRTLVALEGVVTLRVGQAVPVTVPALHAVSFAGEEPVDARLPQGPAVDFNVMTRRAVMTHQARVVVFGENPNHRRMEGTCGVLLCVRGAFRALDGTVVPAGCAYVWDEKEAGRLDGVARDAVGVFAACRPIQTGRT